MNRRRLGIRSEMVVPRTDSGGSTACRRWPPGSRASTNGAASSRRRPARAASRTASWRTDGLVREGHRGRDEAGTAIQPHLIRAVDQHIGHLRVTHEWIQRAQTGELVLQGPGQLIQPGPSRTRPDERSAALIADRSATWRSRTSCVRTAATRPGSSRLTAPPQIRSPTRRSAAPVRPLSRSPQSASSAARRRCRISRTAPTCPAGQPPGRPAATRSAAARPRPARPRGAPAPAGPHDSGDRGRQHQCDGIRGPDEPTGPGPAAESITVRANSARPTSTTRPDRPPDRPLGQRVACPRTGHDGDAAHLGQGSPQGPGVQWRRRVRDLPPATAQAIRDAQHQVQPG